MRIKGMGWRPDLPDFNDYTVEHPSLPRAFSKMMTAPLAAAGLQVESDLRHLFPPVRDQGDLGSCTAHGTTAVVEYCVKKTYGHFTPLSRLFLYKATRDFIGVRGDTGAEIRNALGAAVLFGCPPEEFYPYDVARFDEEPSARIYALASNYKAPQYARLDPEGLDPAGVVEALKSSLLKGWPFVFGFTCYQSLDDVDFTGRVPFPRAGEKITGGHCTAIGAFSDTMQCPNATPGAFGFQNSWSQSWGDHGWGWIPYDYFRRGLAQDCWTVVKADWVDTDQFK